MKKLFAAFMAVFLLVSGSGACLAEERMLSRGEIPLDETGAQVLQELGLFYGTEDGPELERNVTRVEAVVMAVRVTQGKEQVYEGGMGWSTGAISSPLFRDIVYPQHFWAYTDLFRAKAQGIIAGTGDGYFEPERSVTGREFAAMLLRGMDYTDVTTENAYDRGVELGLLLNNFTKSVVKQDMPLLRSDVVRICHAALLTKMADGRQLSDMLIETGAFTGEQFNDVMLCDGVPAAPQEFADKLNAEMPADKNYMFSPLSIKIALAMAANGAEGETREEMLQALGIDDLDAYNAYIKGLMETYAKQSLFQLNIANSIWLNTDYVPGVRFSAPFSELIAAYYSGESREVNNGNAVDEVNAWVDEKTNGKIPEILSESDFLACLVNAVYFKADWRTPFQPEATYEQDFTDRAGAVHSIDFMHDTRYVDYYEDGTLQAVKLPYKTDGGLDINMYIALADRELPDLLTRLGTLEFQSRRVQLALPKFEAEFSTELKESMQKLGMLRAFDETAAQFGPMYDKPVPSWIGSILHKSYIKVDEAGTEAAAVTAVVMPGGSAMPEEPVVFTADRPFTYVIRDDANGEILFAGEYAFVE